MADAARRRPRSATADRALRLLTAGALGGHLGAVACVAAFWAIGGPVAAASAAVACVVSLAFSIIGHGVQVVMADAPPRMLLFASLASYTIRVSLLGIVLMLVLDQADRFAAVDSIAVAVGTIVVVVSWLGAEFFAYSRLRIPVFDPPETNGGP